MRAWTNAGHSSVDIADAGIEVVGDRRHVADMGHASELVQVVSDAPDFANKFGLWAGRTGKARRLVGNMASE